MARIISYRDFDWFLLGVVLLISAVGTVQIYSASLTNTKLGLMHDRQLVWLGAGLIAMFILSSIDYHKLLENVHWAYIVMFLALCAVPLIGVTMLGAKRWIRMPWGLFQPSEWMKLVLVIALAQYASTLNPRNVTWTD